MTRINVTIPCYNYAHYLRECVGSVLSQNIDGLKLTIIDNASTDDSVAVARELAAQDARIELICHETNLGAHASYNEAIDRAEADYFMILCADDILTANALVHGIEIMERFARISCVLGAAMKPWAVDAATVPDIAIAALRQPHGGENMGSEIMEGRAFIENCCASAGQNVPAHAMLVRTSVQKSIGHYRLSLPWMPDLEMAMRLAATGMIARLQGPLVIQRLHGTNLSQALWDDRMNDLSERVAVFSSFFAREGRDIAGANKLHQLARNRLAQMAFWSAVSHLVRGRRWKGLDIFKLGLSLSPAAMMFPFAHLYRTEGALKRALAVISGTVSPG